MHPARYIIIIDISESLDLIIITPHSQFKSN